MKWKLEHAFEEVSMSSSKYTKLVKNTALFAIGNFSTKILTFLIVPLYTYVLTTEEYGRIDLFTTTISFLVPIVTLQVQEAMIRYLVGKEIDEHTAVSNCWAIYLCGTIILIALFPLYKLYFKTTFLALFFTVLLLCNSFNSIFTHYLRAVGKNVAYTIKGIVGTAVLLSLNILFLVVLKLGMMGYLYSMLVSQIVGVSYLLIIGQLWNKLNFKYLEKNWIKKMLMFSIPIIPNSLMWWVMSAGDKYIINYFLGDSANGIYSLSLKIPTIITLFYSIFFQAWQMSAIEENNADGRSQFYETVYKLTNALLAGMIACIIVGIKPLYVLIMSERFAPAWIYVPILALATAFSCQSSFFGVVYTTSEKTRKAFVTTALGAAMNVFFNFLFIRPLGLQGVAIGTCLGYVVISLIRARDCQKEIHMSFDLARTVIAIVILTIQSVVTISLGNIEIAIAGTISILAIILLYRLEVMEILSKAFAMVKRK